MQNPEENRNFPTERNPTFTTEGNPTFTTEGTPTFTTGYLGLLRTIEENRRPFRRPRRRGRRSLGTIEENREENLTTEENLTFTTEENPTFTTEGTPTFTTGYYIGDDEEGGDDDL